MCSIRWCTKPAYGEVDGERYCLGHWAEMLTTVQIKRDEITYGGPNRVPVDRLATVEELHGYRTTKRGHRGEDPNI